VEQLLSMTTWTGRINRVKSTVESIRQYAKDAYIVLTLSEEEFAGKVIPETGVDEIIWCPTDIGPFKKVLYTMEKYPDYPVISVDDDIDYGPVVDALCAMHVKHPDDVITNFPNVKTGGLRLPNGYATLYPPHCLDGAFSMLTSAIVNTKNDDAFYGLVLMAKNYNFRYTMRHDIAIFTEANIGLHLLNKYHGNDDIKVIVSEMYKTGKFNPTNQTFISKYPKEKYVVQQLQYCRVRKHDEENRQHAVHLQGGRGRSGCSDILLW